MKNVLGRVVFELGKGHSESQLLSFCMQPVTESLE